MNAIGTRLAKLERVLLPDRETRRIIQCMGSRKLTEDQLTEWLRSRGVDVRMDDRIIFHCIIGVEPGTMAHVYSGEMGKITLFDPVSGERQTYPGEDAPQ